MTTVPEKSKKESMFIETLSHTFYYPRKIIKEFQSMSNFLERGITMFKTFYANKWCYTLLKKK